MSIEKRKALCYNKKLCRIAALTEGERSKGRSPTGETGEKPPFKRRKALKIKELQL